MQTNKDQASEMPLAPKYKLNAPKDEIRELAYQHCLYVIENEVTGRRYIGHTTDAYQRLKAHYSILKSGKNTQPMMQEDCDTHGIESFNFYLVRVFPDGTHSWDARPEERKLIKQLDDGNLYNKAKHDHPLKKVPYNYSLHKVA